MSFMGPSSETAMWSDISAGAMGSMLGPVGEFFAMVPKMRSQMQTRKLAEGGIQTAGTMDIRAKRREAALRGQFARQRTKDLYASTALQRRLSNAALAARPRVGGSVLGGRGGRYA